ncbi:MAG: hypothetical protein ACJA09_000123 [Alcanivorax sp.]|jgi:hypothetical protein
MHASVKGIAAVQISSTAITYGIARGITYSLFFKPK